MAKYAKTGRFIKEDYPDSPPWFDNFLRLLNKFKDQAEQLFDKKFNITDNMNAGIFEQLLDTTGSVDNAVPTTFKFTQGKPQVVLCGGCWDVTGEELPVATPTFGWMYSEGEVSINPILGLTVGKKYRIVFVVFVS